MPRRVTGGDGKKLHILFLLFQLGDQGGQLLCTLLLGVHHSFGSLGHEAGVGELLGDLLQVAAGLLQLLGDAGLLLLQVHQLGQRHGDLCHVGDYGHVALVGLSLLSHHGDIAGVAQALQEAGACGEDLALCRHGRHVGGDIVARGELDDKEDQDRRVLTRDEQRLLVGAMKDCMYKNAFMLVLQSGLRAGEVGALNWDDVDFENRKIYVKKTLLQAKSRGGFYFGPPKSKHSIREIPMTEEAYRVLKDQYVEQKKMMIRSSNWSDEHKGLVFTTVNGNPVGQSTFRLSLVRIVNNINIELEKQ